MAAETQYPNPLIALQQAALVAMGFPSPPSEGVGNVLHNRLAAPCTGVGFKEGMVDGDAVGERVGNVGFLVGLSDGILVGMADGFSVGARVGCVGFLDGANVGTLVGDGVMVAWQIHKYGSTVSHVAVATCNQDDVAPTSAYSPFDPLPDAPHAPPHVAPDAPTQKCVVGLAKVGEIALFSVPPDVNPGL